MKIKQKKISFEGPVCNASQSSVLPHLLQTRSTLRVKTVVESKVSLLLSGAKNCGSVDESGMRETCYQFTPMKPSSSTHLLDY